MKSKKILSGAFVLLVLSACGNSNQGGAKLQEYPMMNVSMESTIVDAVYPVTIRGKEDIEIRPRIDGFIEAIDVDEGSVVRQGQRLFKINSPSAKEAFISAQAALNSAQAQLNTSEVDVNRIRPLAQKGIVSNVVLQTYENNYTTAQAALAQAKAALENAQETLSWTDVSSPVNGVVGTIPYRLGSLVNNSNALTTVANVSDAYAYFSLNEKDLRDFLNMLEGDTQAEKVKNAPEMTLYLAGGEVYPEKGKLETISGVVNITTGSANFRAKFPNKEGHLRSGTSGNIHIPHPLDSVFIIPQEATYALQDKVLTYVFQGDTAAQRMLTVVPLADGKRYAVTDGLKTGETIITSGIATLSNGKKVKKSENKE